MALPGRRITVFRGQSDVDGRLFIVPDSLSKLLTQIGRKLAVDVEKLYSQDGGLIDDLDLLRDGDVIYAYLGNETFSKAGISAKERESAPAACNDKEIGSGERPMCHKNDWVRLNVGGQYFVTTRSTLVANAPDSMLSRMFSSDGDLPWSSSVDSTGAFLIDRTPIYFQPILNFLRYGELVLDKNVNPKGVLEEARFFGIQSLVEILEKKVKEERPLTDSSPITRREFVMVLMSTATGTELRCQGVNFMGINLSKLDLRNINFKYANLKGANLSGANLAGCNFERADLSHTRLDGANMLGVRMLCVNLEGASMKNCNFEDPAGKQAYLEGANLKFVDLEGSQLAGVNLRVATLRKANLQTCDLRGAILAGADMEDADLTGSDLQEANLRGANLNGAYLDLIVNPLHMSQTIR